VIFLRACRHGMGSVISWDHHSGSHSRDSVDMMDDLQRVLALMFKRKGKSVLSEKEFVFSASIDFRWFTPKEAQRLLEKGLESKLLERSNGFIRPSFDYKKVDVSLNHRPDKNVLIDAEIGREKPLFPTILDLISRDSGLQRREIVARINRVQEQLGVDIEVASLVMARDLGIDIGKLIPEVREEILGR